MAILAALALAAALASAAVPVVSTGSASNIDKTIATLNGEVNPEGVELEECKFEYGLTESYGQTKACDLTPAEIGTGTSPVAVKADLTGLTIATTYHFRIVAKNSEGTVKGFDQTFKTLSPPVIAEWAEGVIRTEATLKAQINPEGFATTYKLEWGPTASYGTTTAVSNVGSDKANHTVFNPLAGLTPGTTYHYRFLATNSIGTAEGPDHTFTTYAPVSLDTGCANQVFRTGAAGQLPDCRAYEMVSPVDKNGGDIAWFDELLVRGSAINQSSLSGDKITYTSLTAFGDTISAPLEKQYIATRHGGEGWTTHAINPPERGGSLEFLAASDREYRAFTPDLSIGWLLPESGFSIAPGAAEHRLNFYKRDNATDSYEALITGSLVEGVPWTQRDFQGATEDGSRAMVTIKIAGKVQLYEWANGELHPVAILPDGTPYTGESSAGRTTSISEVVGRDSVLTHAISDDGSRIFWSTGASGAAGALYVRENPDQVQSALNGSGECTEPAKACTTLIAQAPGFSTQFWTASADGSKAIYRSAGIFTTEFGTLYEYDVDAKTSTLIAHKTYGVGSAGDDASYLYFVSEENLDTGAIEGEKNLYLRHEGVNSFVATLSDVDAGLKIPTVNADSPAFRVSRVTPAGRHLIFMSNRSLTGYDNVDADTGKAASEVYRYDADTGQVSCVSCNPSGARPADSHAMPRGPFVYYGFSYVAAWIPTWQYQLYGTRVVSNDGSRIFFNSFDALVPQDTNGVQDVYEWEAPGAGSCDEGDSSFSELNDGCLTLLSTGESPEESEFVDANTSGDDAFIRTKSSLVPQDPGLIDIYDVRVGGGFAQPPTTPPCVGDSCQSPPEAPRDPTPASAGFHGAGNSTPQKARRNCRARSRHAKGKRQAKSKHTKRCKHNNRRAGR